MYLIYDDEKKCADDCYQMKYNKMKSIADENEGLIIVDPESGRKEYLSNLTKEEIEVTPIFGKKNGSQNREDGFTISINTPKKAYKQDTWYIKEFIELMNNVSGYVNKIENIPIQWFHPL